MSRAESPEALWHRLKEAVLGPDAATDREQRRRALAGRLDRPAVLTRLIDKIHQHAYRVTDEDMQAARAAGFSDGELYELIISASVGAADHRLFAGLAAIEAAASGGQEEKYAP